MKDVRTYLVLALGLVIIYLIWFAEGKKVIQYVKKKDDTEIKKIMDRISNLHIHLASVVEQRKQDSINFVKTAIAYQRQVTYYKKKLFSINFTAYSEKRLDSLVARENAPADTVYCMPIQVARESLEAKEKLPVMDSIIALDEQRLNELAREKFMAELNCENIIADKDKEIAALNEKFTVSADQNKELEKDSKKERRKKIPTIIVSILVGMGLGLLR